MQAKMMMKALHYYFCGWIGKTDNCKNAGIGFTYERASEIDIRKKKTTKKVKRRHDEPPFS